MDARAIGVHHDSCIGEITKVTDRRKILAVLAGGLVLGVGAAVTLAAWNDSEFAQGTFTAGSFNLEGSTTSATTGFQDHESEAGAASLEFTLPLAENLSPTDVVYAPFWVRLDAGTTSPATLVASGITSQSDPAPDNNDEHLSYAVYEIDAAATCDETATTAGTLLAQGGDLTEFTASNDVSLAIGAGSDPGAAAQLCFVVTAESTLVQGEASTATWQFTATSTD